MKLAVVPYPLAIALATSAVFGAAVGSACVATLMHSRIVQSNSKASSLSALCTTKDNAPVTSLSLSAPVPEPQPERPLKGSGDSPAAAPIKPKKASSTANVVSSKAASKTPIELQPVAAIPPPAGAPVVQPKDHTLAKPPSESKIEAVYASKAGVAKVDPDAVILMTGARIAIGDKFPSGETLMQIDAANMRLFTDRRQLILFNAKEIGQ